ncbi:MAG: SIR2 family protein [Planctomycetes bacterium]|nr:SIR2 family protein [Planctomycetota bacterium]
MCYVLGWHRDQGGLNQQDVDGEMGMSPSTWSRIERGESALTMDQLAAVAEVLDVSPSRILRDADNVAAQLARRGVHVERRRVPEAVAQGLALLAGAALVALVASALDDDAKWQPATFGRTSTRNSLPASRPRLWSSPLALPGEPVQTPMGRFRFGDSSNADDTAAGWKQIAQPGPNTKDAGAWGEAQQAVADVLECDHVAVLTGLGTSLCINGPDGGFLVPTMPALWAQTEAAVTPSVLDQVCKDVNYTGADKNIEILLSRCQMALELDPSKKAIKKFVKKAEEVIRNACRPVLAQDATGTHETFLRHLTRHTRRVPRPSVFTTNYDLCFETAAARTGIPIIDGFGFSSQPRFQPEVFDHDIVTGTSYSKEPGYIPRVVRLFKLHGSVDWERGPTAFERNRDTNSPILIYPRSAKYSASYDPPFLELMGRFLSCLRQRSVGLLVCCFGFNDKHVAEPVLAAVKSNPSLKLLVCAPDLSIEGGKGIGRKDGKCMLTENDYLKQLAFLESGGDSRITLLSAKFPDLVRLMPDVSLQSADERQAALVLAMAKVLAKESTQGGGAG